LETQELLRKVRKLEIKTRRLSDQLFSGEYHSSFKGRGMAFSEVRQYQPGDDIRAIDWNVTARKREPYIKVFEEERELTLMLLVDVSGSEGFGSRVQQKREMITEICATLAFSALTNNDKVGLLLFSDRIEKFIPPVKGRQNVLRIIRELVEHESAGKQTDIDQALEYLNGVIKKKAIVFLLSDFLAEDYDRSLKVTAKKHDLTGIRVFDAMDEALPNVGIIPAIDPETGEIGWLNTASRKVRQKYWQANHNKIDFYRKNFHRNGAGVVEIGVEQSYVKQLMGYFKRREARR
jgi:uncharacterized protein (DUF58 family)